tara:strand:+ start:3417 stop:4280 length:864 start_codon:yes stop_codon:yes gene_type:complete
MANRRRKKHTTPMGDNPPHTTVTMNTATRPTYKSIDLVTDNIEKTLRKDDLPDALGDPILAPNWLAITHWYTPVENTFGSFYYAIKSQIIIYVVMICALSATSLAIFDVAYPTERQHETSSLVGTASTSVSFLIAIVVAKTIDITTDNNRAVISRIGRLYGRYTAIINLSRTSPKFYKQFNSIDSKSHSDVRRAQLKFLNKYNDVITETADNVRSILDSRIHTHAVYNTFGPLTNFIGTEQFTDTIVEFEGTVGEVIALRNLPIPFKYHQVGWLAGWLCVHRLSTPY